MTTLTQRIKQLLRRRPFTVLGYSAEDDTYCPTCLRLATGLSPNGVDTNGKPILPLHAREVLFHDEVCCNCHQPLVDLIPGLQPSLTFRVHRERQVPDSTIVQHDPVGTLILHADGRGVFFTNLAEEPFSIFPEPATAPKLERVAVPPRPPTIRRRSLAPAAA